LRGGFIPRDENSTQLKKLLKSKVKLFVSHFHCSNTQHLDQAGIPGVGAYSADVIEDKRRGLSGRGGLLDKSGSSDRGQGGSRQPLRQQHCVDVSCTVLVVVMLTFVLRAERVQEVEVVMNNSAKLPGPGQ
jgi:hypothetical protein